MTKPARHEGCSICTTEDAEASTVVFRDELWAAEVVAGYEVPGWVILRVRRHAERITGLADAELASFAYRARDLVEAVSEVMAAPATYLLVFGEKYPHFHVLIVPRGEDVPADRLAGDILKLRSDRADPDAARQLVPGIAKAYTQAVQRRESAQNR